MDQTIKKDAGKLELSKVPTQIIKDIAEVRMYGNKKYGDSESWKQVEKQRYIDAMFRHFLEYLIDSKAVDKESGIPHLKHLACNAAFLSELEQWENDRINKSTEDNSEKNNQRTHETRLHKRRTRRTCRSKY